MATDIVRSSDNDDSRMAKYDDLVRSSDLFWEKLTALLGSTTQTLKVPKMAGQRLDLHRLFIEVTSRGGFEKVIHDRKWKEVIGTFNFPRPVTSGSFVLRKYYLKFLYQLEHVYYVPNQVSSIQSRGVIMRSIANVSPKPREGVTMRRLVNVSPNPREGVIIRNLANVSPNPGEGVTVRSISNVSQNPGKGVIMRRLAYVSPNPGEGVIMRSLANVSTNPVEGVTVRSLAIVSPNPEEGETIRTLANVSQNPEEGEAMRTLANVWPNLEEEHAGIEGRQIGCVVHGFVDGKFDSGYLVTAKMGSEELRGVLYHIPQAPSQPQQNLETSPAIVPASSQHRPRKRQRVHSQKPKSHRSGYNFFYAEHYPMLKPGYDNNYLIKLIAYMWSKLTVSEKQFYQEKGIKDLERYRREMLEYNKSAHESGDASTSDAATVAHQ